MKNVQVALVLFFIFLIGCNNNRNVERVDVLIIGGGASGTSAGIQAARMGCNTLIVEETTWLGGMLTSAGVSAIDGNHRLPSGIWGEFRDSLFNRYGSPEALKTGWVSNVLFEPSVGNSVFKSIVDNEPLLNVLYEAICISVERKNSKWKVKLQVNGKTKYIESPVLIDATELGDIAKLCGVKYDIGMESRDKTKESIAPPASNNIVQDLTYVAILKDYGYDVPVARPDGYDPALFACTCTNDLCVSPKEPERMWSKEMMITYGKLPNDKYMINWPIEGNDYYVNLIEMSREERTEALKKAKHHTLCYLYFLQSELGFTTFGLADDEYPTDDRLPFIPYHRESRRIHGKVRFLLEHITDPYKQTQKLYRTNVAVGDYPVDHHHLRYDGTEELPDLHFYAIPSYGLPLGTLIPENTKGLIVAEKSISVSNIVNGTTRLQPVVLQIGQVAGVLAAISVKENINIEDISVRTVQKTLLDNNGYIMPFLDVSHEHKLFKAFQRIGATGILQGEGRNEGWANQTWLRSGELLLPSELEGLKEIYPYVSLGGLSENVTVLETMALIKTIAEAEKIVLPEDINRIAKDICTTNDLKLPENNEAVTREIFALLVDELLNPFDKEVDIYGDFR